MPTWRITSMSRAMLVAMLKCLVHHEFILPKDVDYHEAIRALESEGTNRSPRTHTYTCTRTRMLP